MSRPEVSASESQLHIETVGSGPDLVMLHGWAMHGGIWAGVTQQLAKHFRLHRVDLPGHGLSHNCPLNSLESMVNQIAGHLPDAYTVCGWSLGGQIAIKLALCAPERVRRLILVATTPCFVKRHDWPWGMTHQTLQLFMDNLERDYAQTLNRFLTLQVSGGSDQSKVLTQLRHSLLQRAQPEQQVLQRGLKILMTSDLRTELKGIIQPALLIHGEKDMITPANAATWMQQQLPRANLTMFPNCGHAPFLAFPELFVECLNAL